MLSLKVSYMYLQNERLEFSLHPKCHHLQKEMTTFKICPLIQNTYSWKQYFYVNLQYNTQQNLEWVDRVEFFNPAAKMSLFGYTLDDSYCSILNIKINTWVRTHLSWIWWRWSRQNSHRPREVQTHGGQSSRSSL